MNGYKESLRQYFSVQAKALRKKRKLTQEEMSEQLHITVRAYGDLERGCSCCSAIALLFFLLMLEPDELTAFLAQMKKQFRDQDQQEVVWGDGIFEKCGIRRDEGGDGGKTLEIRGKRRLPARDGGANYQQS